MLALTSLRRAGLPVIAVTGRPAGWSEPFVASWPVEAIVAENGGVLLRRNGVRIARAFAQPDDVVDANEGRLAAIAKRIVREVAGARLARDSDGRLTDIAIDHAEFERLPPAAIERVVAIMREEGLNATVSSIHVNGWFGSHDKLSGARWAVRECLGRDLDPEIDRWIYVGDSANDQVMFRAIPLSVGVANIAPVLAALEHPPRYITLRERGAGFAEAVEMLLERRR